MDKTLQVLGAGIHIAIEAAVLAPDGLSRAVECRRIPGNEFAADSARRAEDAFGRDGTRFDGFVVAATGLIREEESLNHARALRFANRLASSDTLR